MLVHFLSAQLWSWSITKKLDIKYTPISKEQDSQDCVDEFIDRLEPGLKNVNYSKVILEHFSADIENRF